VTPQAVTGLALAAVPSAVRCSRMFVNSCLRQWGLPSLTDDSEVVVSELVTNAVTATGVTEAEPRWSQLAGLATIHVRVMLFEGSIVIAVWDRNPAPPVLRQSAPDSENGRGLSIVAALCQRWDYFLLDGGGKCIWAELAIQPDALASAGLPRRVPASSGVRAAESRTDPALLRRVHEGLKNL
jgi:anti-sigma regulatory factor (Ser/Thr protein kinase)